jgi:hypothetical protein
MADERRPADKPDDATQIGPPVDPWHAADDDATQVGPPLRPSTPHDATRVAGAPVSGAPISGAPVSGGGAPRAHGAGPGTGPDPAKWTARAGVRPPGSPASTRPAAWEEEGPAVDPYGGRSWFTPIAVALIVLILLAVLAVGGWLIYRATQSGGPSDEPSGEPTASTPAVTSAPPTSAPATSAPPTTAPAMVAVPEVIGDTEAEATAKFTVAGIRVEIVRRVTTDQPAGRVVATTPGPGAMVPVGSTVQVVVAQAPATTAPATPPPSSAGP